MFYELSLDENKVEFLRELRRKKEIDNNSQVMYEYQLEELRKELIRKLEEYTDNKKIKLNIESKEIEELIFIKHSEYIAEAFDFELIKKLDLTGVSFEQVCIEDVDFTGSYGVQINPQTVYNKNCRDTKFCDVEIVGSFDGVCIIDANFKGSKGAQINPQRILNKNCSRVVFRDAKIIGSFDDVSIIGADFTGSYGAKINPQTIYNRNCMFVNFCDVELIEPLDDVDICGAKLDGVVNFSEESNVKKRVKSKNEE
jgi:uncharacterized protein YjbI with pentapeptide repeats